MKLSKPLFTLAALMAMAASVPAWADHYHGGTRVGVVIGTPGYWHYRDPYFYQPYPYPYPYYAYPPVVVTPAEPPTYIEQAPAAQSQSQAPAPNDWYYCRKPDGYYPYVKQCPGGWQRVAPQPPSQP